MVARLRDYNISRSHDNLREYITFDPFSLDDIPQTLGEEQGNENPSNILPNQYYTITEAANYLDNPHVLDNPPVKSKKRSKKKTALKKPKKAEKIKIQNSIQSLEL